MSDRIWHLTIDEDRLKQKIANNVRHVCMKFSFETMCIKQGHTGSKYSLLSAHNTELVGDKYLVCLRSEVNEPTK